MAKAEMELRGDASSVLAGMGRARRVVLRHQLEVAEEMGHAFVEVPTDLLRELLGPVDVPPARRRAFGLVAAARERQERGGSPMVGDSLVASVGARFGVVCAMVMTGHSTRTPADFERELADLAAVPVAWLELRGGS